VIGEDCFPHASHIMCSDIDIVDNISNKFMIAKKYDFNNRMSKIIDLLYSHACDELSDQFAYKFINKYMMKLIEEYNKQDLLFSREEHVTIIYHTHVSNVVNKLNKSRNRAHPALTLGCLLAMDDEYNNMLLNNKIHKFKFTHGVASNKYNEYTQEELNDYVNDCEKLGKILKDNSIIYKLNT
jgi:hypothetical protein